MSAITISLVKINRNNLPSGFIAPFWFTSDHSIDLTSRKQPSVRIILEQLSERSFLELFSAFKLGLVECDDPCLLKGFKEKVIGY